MAVVGAANSALAPFCAQHPAFPLLDDDGQRVRLICVPDFAATHTAVLLDLETLECEPMFLGGPAAKGADADADAGAGAGGDAMDIAPDTA